MPSETLFSGLQCAAMPSVAIDRVGDDPNDGTTHIRPRMRRVHGGRPGTL
jgi:hypothetical protein